MPPGKLDEGNIGLVVPRDPAKRLRSRGPSTDPNGFWNELEVRLLGNEAEATILYDPAFPADRLRAERPSQIARVFGLQLTARGRIRRPEPIKQSFSRRRQSGSNRGVSQIFRSPWRV
jgi:hypothetical protein